MKRALRFALSTVAFAGIWLIMLFHAQILPGLELSPAVDLVIPAIPLWLLVTFGSYSLANLGWALIIFGDCPAAQVSLLKEIQTAKMDLRSHGVSID
ncbi:hypothetical protein BATDEDRAFT_85358 [Batrachochytrium dendrobatidis JAM81]|uniref:Dolichol-phosphate mannosyltransferase subunit 3 n=1 Tax=Batrachochytrium dendrobatidis (strain JAM81 / FGSC 10211) TaxID=684364 RepID=F4NS53_BATDJ|nr:uncharacterized protein BATDEDRAFT_85358 [Batrachochytrium dendrobatidis JAM81]EGF84224.1 hypothetical protein BATDEDRAFT_85358 [Batrachochytrium dendrobatidis JAM81]KAJ8326867.1 Dolichol-phosphate mannosyltransferase subunit 3 [Batrachochytrium dendrobatidis]KAK5668333.1 Dolichol-phosphate mannosyltransferase subunit 3 [Batrachochytrium dendrobatidis]|eukprot:XP_006676379.1 hypothetical protein BATDEDRAFT_85358 [Batrachochytrium dendrobatidis JAM81]